jgi:3-oxoacyl-[acyl-carrier protein] reductase
MPEQSRTAVVTGGAGGIGSALTRRLAASGHRMVVTFRHHKDQAQALAEELAAAGGEAVALPFDLTDPESPGDLVAQVHDAFGPIEILVNNAVVWPERMVGGSEDADALLEAGWRDSLRGTVEGTLALTEAALPDMTAANWGRVVLMSSGVVRIGMANRVAYGASKAALHGAARSLAWQVGPRSVTVNVVVPGVIATERIRNATGPFGDVVADLIAHTPLGRLATPEEVGATVDFLTSAAASGLTGQQIAVDGGQT